MALHILTRIRAKSSFRPVGLQINREGTEKKRNLESARGDTMKTRRPCEAPRYVNALRLNIPDNRKI